MSYRERLKDALAKSNVGRRELADALGVSPQAIGSVLIGNTKALTAENNAKAAKVLRVDPNWLATGQHPDNIAQTTQAEFHRWGETLREPLPPPAPAATPDTLGQHLLKLSEMLKDASPGARAAVVSLLSEGLLAPQLAEGHARRLDAMFAVHHFRPKTEHTDSPDNMQLMSDNEHQSQWAVPQKNLAPVEDPEQWAKRKPSGGEW